MLLVNVFGAPGAGKSTCAAYVFAKLKMLGYDIEYALEFAKDKVWEESKEAFRNQAYIFGQQFFRISRCENKVDVVITDSPLVLSAFYCSDERLGDVFTQLVLNVFKSYNSLNYFLARVQPYNPNGRFQTEEESDKIAVTLSEMLDNYGIEYTTVPGCVESYDKIVDDVVEALKKQNEK